MESVLHASHETIVAEYLSEFLEQEDVGVDPQALDDYVSSFSCPNSPTSPTMSSPKYRRISLTLSGYRPRPKRSTQARKRKSTDAC